MFLLWGSVLQETHLVLPLQGWGIVVQQQVTCLACGRQVQKQVRPARLGAVLYFYIQPAKVKPRICQQAYLCKVRYKTSDLDCSSSQYFILIHKLLQFTLSKQDGINFKRQFCRAGNVGQWQYFPGSWYGFSWEFTHMVTQCYNVLITPTIWKWRSEYHKFKAILVYKTNSKIA